VLIGIVASNDIDFALDNSRLWLDPYSGRGRPIDRGAWRKLLNGASSLREPVQVEPRIKDFSIGPVRQAASW
jgi:hypothetical protein